MELFVNVEEKRYLFLKLKIGNRAKAYVYLNIHKSKYLENNWNLMSKTYYVSNYIYI